MDTLDFFRQYKIAPIQPDVICCEACALYGDCGAYFCGCPAPVGYNFQKKGGEQ